MVLLQQQQQQTQEVEISPETVIPKWSAIFDDQTYQNSPTPTTTGELNILDDKTCVVGEANKFNNNYVQNCKYCARCASTTDTGQGFIDLYWRIQNKLENDWRNTELVKSFLKHMQQECHL